MSKLNTAEEEGHAKLTQQMCLSLKTPGAVHGFRVLAMPHSLAMQQQEKQKPSPAKF